MMARGSCWRKVYVGERFTLARGTCCGEEFMLAKGSCPLGDASDSTRDGSRRKRQTQLGRAKHETIEKEDDTSIR